MPSDKFVRAVHKAETLVRFSWLAAPTTFLLLKKPGVPDITRALFQIGMHLTSRASGGSIARLIVEPAVYREMAGSELQLYTWDDGATSPIAPESAIDITTLAEVVDLVICLGGDGTLLWASTLFQQAMPPVISFSMVRWGS